MSNSKLDMFIPTASFTFFDFLRYLLPGFIFSFSIFGILFQSYITYFNLTFLILIGLSSGFVINSIGLYKLLPQIKNIIKDYRTTISKISNVKKIYLFWDVLDIIMTTREKETFKRRFSIATAKLDLAFIFFLLFIIIIFIRIVSYFNIQILLQNNLSDMEIGFILFILLVSTLALYFDGKKDLKRCYQIGLILATKYQTNEFMPILKSNQIMAQEKNLSSAPSNREGRASVRKRNNVGENKKTPPA